MSFFLRRSAALRKWVAYAPWSRLPAPLWFLVASPLLAWALETGGPWFRWPYGVPRSPFRREFWGEGRAE